MKIKYDWNICRGCSLPKLITHKQLQLCTACNKKRLSRLYRARLKERIRAGKITDKQRLGRFFKKYWREHPDRRCFESNEKLYRYKKWHIHHLIEKSEHPELAYKQDNVVYLSLLMHRLWHDLTDEQRKIEMPKTYERTQEIKKKYNVAD